MRFRRVIIFLLILFCSYTPPILASTMYDFTTSESIVINNVPGTSTLSISPLVIDNLGPALSIDSIRAESLGEWSIVSDSVTDWGNISADAKCFGIVWNCAQCKFLGQRFLANLDIHLEYTCRTR